MNHNRSTLNCHRWLTICLTFWWVWAGVPISTTWGQTVRRPNVLLICVDDLRPELKCFGKDYIHSPHIDRLASEGVSFVRHYVQAPTCGASRYTLLTGQYGGSGNDALFRRAKRMRDQPNKVRPSLPEWFRQHQYTTVSVGKVSHHPGGRGGVHWDQDDQIEMPGAWDRHLCPSGAWQHPRGLMHGLANGEIRINSAKMDVFQSVDGPDSIYPDGLTIAEATKQMEILSNDGKPFFLAVGIIRPHLPLGAPAQYLKHYVDIDLPPIPHPDKPNGKTTWHPSSEFRQYRLGGRDPNSDGEFADQVRRHYAACVSYADAQVGRLVEKLNELQQADNTIIIVWGDHGWHLGEHAIWGKHALYEESLRSPLIIRSPARNQAGATTQAIVETVDLFPTLCELAGLPVPDFVDGVSLNPILNDPTIAWDRPAISYSNAKTIRTDQYRLIEHTDGFVELYDHWTPEGETLNVAQRNSEVVAELSKQLNDRLQRRDGRK
jgi:iduronate 2-sulfatase